MSTAHKLEETELRGEIRSLLYSQLYGLGSRHSSCAWIEGGDVVGTGNSVDLHGGRKGSSWTPDHHRYQGSSWSQGLDSWLLPCCCGNLSPLHWAGGK